MTTTTIWVLQLFKPMTIATTAGLARARALICYSYSMTTAAQPFAQPFAQRSAQRSAQHDYMTTRLPAAALAHVAVQHTCLVNGCLGNGCLGNGCLGMDRAADGGVGPAAGRSRWRRVREQNFFLHHAVTRQVAQT